MTLINGKVIVMTYWSFIQEIVMRNLRSYPGVFTVLLIAAALAVNGVVDFINEELAGPSFLGSVSLLVSALVLVAVYEFRNMRQNRKLAVNPVKK
jgi:hypothetical protein